MDISTCMENSTLHHSSKTFKFVTKRRGRELMPYICNSICNIFNEHISAYNLRQSDFSTPRYNTVTYGKHSLRYVGPKLWGKLSMADRSAKTPQAFTNCIHKRDITRSMDTGCKGCILCCT